MSAALFLSPSATCNDWKLLIPSAVWATTSPSNTAWRTGSAETASAQMELQLAAREAPPHVLVRAPGPVVPEKHRAAAVFPGRDRPLERAVCERVVFDLDRQAFLRRIETRSLRHGPALQNAVVFETEVIMQAPRRVFLHDELPF